MVDHRFDIMERGALAPAAARAYFHSGVTR
jgi:hypothetical protein